jgi:hypothetical protein
MSSKAYQVYRERNACLARAADAWRRGDVQLAKRFTREGHELNAKMRSEGREGGRRALLEWVDGFREEFDAVAANDHRTAASPISDTDEWALGEAVANGLGVCLGRAPGGDVEVYIDLRGLFADDVVELLEEYLMILERDGFAGLGERGFSFLFSMERAKADLLVFAQRMLQLGRTLSLTMHRRTGSLERPRTGSVGGRTPGWRSTFRLRVWALVDCSVSTRSLMSSKLGSKVQKHQGPKQEEGKKERRSNVKA